MLNIKIKQNIDFLNNAIQITSSTNSFSNNYGIFFTSFESISPFQPHENIIELQ